MEKAQALDVTELPSDLSFPSQGYLQFRPTALQFPVIAISILTHLSSSLHGYSKTLCLKTGTVKEVIIWRKCLRRLYDIMVTDKEIYC